MNLTKLSYLLTGLIVIMIYMQSCKKNPCETVVCLNGSFCVNGTCECPLGFAGDNCEITLTVQQRLDTGEETPISLAKGGVLLDSLYGKRYAGGIMFYIDTNDSIPDIEGMVAAMEDQGDGNFGWGCSGSDILNLNNVVDMNLIQGARIGDGRANTDLILAECDDINSAAKLCYDYQGGGFDDWFLPSRSELYLMHSNLYMKGHGGFFAYYWSSTEANEFFSWEIYFPLTELCRASKEINISVRAARAF